MKKIILVIIFGLLLGGGAFWYFQQGQQQNTSQKPTGNTTQTQQNNNATGIKKSAIEVADQVGGNTATISHVVLETAGYVMIHASMAGKPGIIIGHSMLLNSGESSNVAVMAPLLGDNSYFAMLHGDDGDGVYDPAKDLPVKDSQGNIVMMEFKVSRPTAPIPQKTIQKIAIQNLTFSPDTVSVKKGTVIVFTNNDSAPHTVTSSQFTGSGTLNTTNTFTLDTATLAPGTYSYHCNFHPSMKGIITITE